MGTFNFSVALDQLKEGKSVSRSGWNGKGIFITMQVPDAHSKMTRPYVYITIPAGTSEQFGQEGTVDQRIPWLCSQTDLLADDWFEVE